MNVKLYFDVMTAVLRHLTIESFKALSARDGQARDDFEKEEQHAEGQNKSITSEVYLQAAVEAFSLLTRSVQSMEGMQVGDCIGNKFYSAMHEAFRLCEQVPDITVFVLDLVYWLVEVIKEEGQIELYNLKTGIIIDSLVRIIKAELRIDNDS